MQNFYAVVRTIVEKSKGNKFILESLESYIKRKPVLVSLMEEYSTLYNNSLSKKPKKFILSENTANKINKEVTLLLEYFNINEVIEDDFEKQLNEMLKVSEPKKFTKKQILEKTNNNLKELNHLEKKILLSYNSKPKELSENFIRLKNIYKEVNNEYYNTLLLECEDTLTSLLKENKLKEASLKLTLLKEGLNDFVINVDSPNLESPVKNFKGFVYNKENPTSISISFTLDLKQKSSSFEEVQEKFIKFKEVNKQSTLAKELQLRNSEIFYRSKSTTQEEPVLEPNSSLRAEIVIDFALQVNVDKSKLTGDLFKQIEKQTVGLVNKIYKDI